MPDFKARVKQGLAAAGHSPDDDIVDELASHAAAAYEAARADGSDAADADRRIEAIIAVWCADAERLARRPKRAPAVPAPASAGHAWAGVAQDFRYGLRLLRRQPGFALVAILTMALSIGATTTLFSVTYGVLMKPLPWPDADRLVRVTETREGHEPRVRGTISNAVYNEWSGRQLTVSGISGWLNRPVTLSIDGGEATRVQSAVVTPSLFSVLQARPLFGRLFVDNDARTAPAAVVILSYGLWQERFGGEAAVVGRVVQMDRRPATVVGIMPKGFVFPDRLTRAWVPWAVPPVVGEKAMSVVIFSGLARLRPGATPQQAGAEGTARARSAPDLGLAGVALFGGKGPSEIRAVPAIEMMTADVRPALLVLLAAVALLLVTATANVASLQLARAASRRREMAVRAAIGAGAGRLARQLVAESALIGAGGGAAGLVLTVLLHRALPSLLPADFPRVEAVSVDWRVMLFIVCASTAASIVCGLLPAMHARRVNLVELLCEDGNAPVGGSLRTRTARARTIIMAGQLAVSCVLLVGAALLTRGFVALLRADRGYDPTNVLTARVVFPESYSVERRTTLLDAVAGRLRGQAGVREAAFGNALPLLTSGGFRAFKMRPAFDPSIEVEANVIQRVVSPEYFGALGLRLTAGRALKPSDTATAQSVIVVNRSFADKYLGRQALGTVLSDLGMCRGSQDRWEVVGIVDDMRQSAFSEPPQPEMFIPARQIGCANAIAQAIFTVRTADAPLASAAALRSFVREQDASLAVDSVMTMEDRVMTALAKPRLYAVVIVGFACFALAIAGVGLFGVMAYSVAQRTREIGVRTALGAQPSDIVRLVLKQAVFIVLGGTAAGLWAAFAAARVLSTFLYGVGPRDPVTFLAVAALVAIISALACVLPARRAARVDPLQVLR